jgi:RHS repeat-associated protein
LYAVSTDAISPQNNVYSTTLRNRSLLQGQDFQKDLDLNWYQFEARMHEPALGRFTSVDPSADKFSSVTPYNYTLNNPIAFGDPDGRSPVYHPIYGAMANNWDPMAGAAQSYQNQINAYYQRQAGISIVGSYIETQQAAAWQADVLRRQGNGVTNSIGAQYANGDFGGWNQFMHYAGALVPGAGIAQGLLDIRGGNYGSAALNLGSSIFEFGAIARSVKSINLVEQLTARMNGHLDYAIKNYSLSQAQVSAGLKYPNLMKAYTGSSIDKLFKARVNTDDFLIANNVNTTGLFKFGPDVFNTQMKAWWDVTTPAQWGAHMNLYTPNFGTGYPLFYSYPYGSYVPVIGAK